jgi:hypothetical protein
VSAATDKSQPSGMSDELKGVLAELTARSERRRTARGAGLVVASSVALLAGDLVCLALDVGATRGFQGSAVLAAVAALFAGGSLLLPSPGDKPDPDELLTGRVCALRFGFFFFSVATMFAVFAGLASV